LAGNIPVDPTLCVHLLVELIDRQGVSRQTQRLPPVEVVLPVGWTAEAMGGGWVGSPGYSKIR